MLKLNNQLLHRFHIVLPTNDGPYFQLYPSYEANHRGQGRYSPCRSALSQGIESVQEPMAEMLELAGIRTVISNRGRGHGRGSYAEVVSAVKTFPQRSSPTAA